MQRDPLGVSDRNGKPHIRAGGNKLKVTSALQSLDDKIRIATKVSRVEIKKKILFIIFMFV